MADNIRKFGFGRVGLAIPLVKVADPGYNSGEIISLIKNAVNEKVDVVLFPELSVTSYTAGDLFQQEVLLEASQKSLARILDETKDYKILIAVGAPITCDNQLFNCAFILHQGEILGIVPKSYIPTYKEFYEKRWFSPAKNLRSRKIKLLGKTVPIGTDIIFKAVNFPQMIVGVEICEDLWVPIPPSAYQALAGATLHLNLSASNSIIGKADYRRGLVSGRSGTFISAYAYCSSGVGESTTDVIFDGHGIIAENGTILAESERFLRSGQLVIQDIDFGRLTFDRRQITSFGDNVQKLGNKKFRIVEFDLPDTADTSLKRTVPAHPFIPLDLSQRDKVCKEIFLDQTAALAKRLETGSTGKLLIGISGGLDSTLALLTAIKTFDLLGWDRKNIIAITMPGFGTSSRTKNNAIKLCRALGVALEEIDIKDGCNQQFKDIGHDPKNQNVVFENVQARYRTLTLFNKGNQGKGLVEGTGDLSEIAFGWCTYGGDHISHYNPNAGIPKGLVRYIVLWVADTQVEGEVKAIIYDIVDTPVSPELVKQAETITQKTDEIIGPDELRDFFLYYLVRWGMKPTKIIFLAKTAFGEKYPTEEIRKWLELFIRKFFGNQWKRSCVPDGLKIGSVGLSPRGDWRMPSDAEVSAWLRDLKEKK